MNLIKIACKTGRYNNAVCFRSCTGGQGVYTLCLCLWELVQPLTEAVAFFRSDPAAPASPWAPRSLTVLDGPSPIAPRLTAAKQFSSLRTSHSRNTRRYFLRSNNNNKNKQERVAFHPVRAVRRHFANTCRDGLWSGKLGSRHGQKEEHSLEEKSGKCGTCKQHLLSFSCFSAVCWDFVLNFYMC